ncbi:hypothetical protein ACGFNX_39775 [Streptomyces sp. NPDC048723]|uniref:hypothetical protein n=1 Tax=Streptomyces sp. NPDC048723 TaxID=3365589 RepID=UPI003711DC33
MCGCGRRGAAPYRLDRDTVGDQPLYEADVDLTGPLAGWTAHLSVVRDAAVPLPEQLTVLLAEMAGQLTATAADAPLAALRAAGTSAEAVATALGPTYPKALVPAHDRAGQVTARITVSASSASPRARRKV